MACIMNVGYGHPRLVEAITTQAQRLVHGNPAYVVHEGMVRLAQRLDELTPGDFPKRVAFGLSGSDANDGAVKLARAATGRQLIVAFHGAYHGNTYGALSLSAVSPAMRRGFGPVLPGVVHVRYPDAYRRHHGLTGAEVTAACLEELTATLGALAPPEDVAAIVVEPVQGDSGILVPPPSFLPALAELASRHGILLVAEEVQTGFGRTGARFAVEHDGVVPDILVLGKALGGGMPISAVVARSELMDAWEAPGHVFSTSGNPVTTAAALAVLDILEDEQLVEAARARGATLRAGLEELARAHEVVGDVRGRGLMLGVDLVADPGTRARDRLLAAKVVKGCFDRGCFLTFLAGSVLRFVPPLVISDEQVQEAVEIVGKALADALAGKVGDDEVAQFTGW
jgi:4-aminobutyrate aminotransferase